MITTYESYIAEDAWFKNRRWMYCVLDEGHKIKNSEINLSRKVQGIGSLFRLSSLFQFFPFTTQKANLLANSPDRDTCTKQPYRTLGSSPLALSCGFHPGHGKPVQKFVRYQSRNIQYPLPHLRKATCLNYHASSFQGNRRGRRTTQGGVDSVHTIDRGTAILDV